MSIGQGKKPLARREGLVVKEVGGEVLIFDTERDQAHCLNDTAARVWKRCDGKNDAATIAWLLEKDLNAPVDEKVVWYALAQFGKDHLLEEPITAPMLMTGLNRRQMIRTLGVAAALAIPVVTSIVAPTPAQAATCLDNGVSCTSSAQCCSGLCQGGGTCA